MSVKSLDCSLSILRHHTLCAPVAEPIFGSTSSFIGFSKGVVVAILPYKHRKY